MDSGYRSPLLELFRRGEAERAVRLAGAQGALRLRAHDQLALLMMLVDDADAEIAEQAATTIAALPSAALSSFLARADVSAAMRGFFAARGVAPAQDASADQTELLEAGDDAEETAPDAARSAVPLSTLSVIERLKLATKGTREQRAQLIRDPNRIVATAVLSSPKVNESEVEAFVKMGSVTEDVLRVIGANRSWMKHYGVAHGLARNPKTPPAISMQILNRLLERDVKALTTDRNVPEALRLAARRVLSRGQR